MAGWCLKKDTRYRRHCTRLPSAVPGAGGQSALATGRAYTLAFPSPCERKESSCLASIRRSDGRVFVQEENARKDRREATRGFWRVSLATSQRNGPIVIAVVVVVVVVVIVVVVVVVVVVVCLHRESGRTAGETRASGRGSTTGEREREREGEEERETE